MPLFFRTHIDKSDVFVIVAGAAVLSILILVLNSVVNTPIPKFNYTTATIVNASNSSFSFGANGIISNFNGSNMSHVANAAAQTNKDGSSYIVHNATIATPCKDDPEMLCLSQTQTEVEPNAIRCKNNPNVICYPPQNYTRNYKPTIVPPLTPICTYDPSGVIICTSPQLKR